MKGTGEPELTEPSGLCLPITHPQDWYLNLRSVFDLIIIIDKAEIKLLQWDGTSQTMMVVIRRIFERRLRVDSKLQQTQVPFAIRSIYCVLARSNVSYLGFYTWCCESYKCNTGASRTICPLSAVLRSQCSKTILELFQSLLSLIVIYTQKDWRWGACFLSNNSHILGRPDGCGCNVQVDILPCFLDTCWATLRALRQPA